MAAPSVTWNIDGSFIMGIATLVGVIFTWNQAILARKDAKSAKTSADAASAQGVANGVKTDVLTLKTADIAHKADLISAKADTTSAKADVAIVQSTKAAEQSKTASDASTNLIKQIDNDLPHLVKAVQEIQARLGPGAAGVTITDPSGKGNIL